MTPTAGTDGKIESYLARVRTALRGLPERETDDILRELRSHIDELSAEDGVEAALRSLGDPVDLARTYRAENQMLRAQCTGSPLVILTGLRRATRSGLGRITATALYFFGYSNALTLWAAALVKVFAPARGGLWYIPGHPGSITLVIEAYPPPGARELLGWWLVPLALVLGWAIRRLTDRLAQAWIRRYRRLHPQPGV